MYISTNSLMTKFLSISGPIKWGIAFSDWPRSNVFEFGSDSTCRFCPLGKSFTYLRLGRKLHNSTFYVFTICTTTITLCLICAKLRKLSTSPFLTRFIAPRILAKKKTNWKKWKNNGDIEIWKNLYIFSFFKCCF